MWPSGGGRGRVLSSGKSKAGVTSNRRLCSTYCTIKANYWQTRSIARPLCDSRATCNQSSDIAVAQRIGVVEIVRTEMLDRTVSNSTSEWLTSCCAMLYISAAYAVMQCLSVRLSICLSVTFVDSVETNYRTFNIFSPSGSHTCTNIINKSDVIRCY